MCLCPLHHSPLGLTGAVSRGRRASALESHGSDSHGSSLTVWTDDGSPACRDGLSLLPAVRPPHPFAFPATLATGPAEPWSVTGMWPGPLCLSMTMLLLYLDGHLLFEDILFYFQLSKVFLKE